MKKVRPEICSTTDEIDLKVEQECDGSRPGYLTVICNDLVERDETMKRIRKYKTHLTPITLLVGNCCELEYKDKDYPYSLFGFSKSEQLNLSDPAKTKSITSKLLELMDANLQSLK
jgi:hypothetical protein